MRRYKRPQHKWLWRLAELAPFGGTLIEFESPYLMRVYLTPGEVDFRRWGFTGGHWYLPNLAEARLPRIYLHFFFQGDEDRELHNHPWSRSWSYILTGGYLEERWNAYHRWTDRFLLVPGKVNSIARDDYHRVTLLKPEEGCWTLFLSFGRVQKSDGTDWGFFDTDSEQYTPWGKFVASRP